MKSGKLQQTADACNSDPERVNDNVLSPMSNWATRCAQAKGE
jgi:hypothetical protein